MAPKKKTPVYQQAPPTFHPQLPPDEPVVEKDASFFKPIDIDELDDKINQQLTDFSGLLDEISSIEDKQKALWKQIYENAVQDRKNAYIMWTDLYGYVHCNPTEYAIHGQNLSRYMERMSKANDQILKLAELVSGASENELEDMMSQDDIYDKIQKTSHKQ